MAKKSKQSKSSKRSASTKKSTGKAPRSSARRGKAATTARGASTGRIKRSRAESSHRAELLRAATLHPNALGEMISLRAFLKWQERGGDEISNWVEAEREIQAELDAAASPRQAVPLAIRTPRH